MAVWFTADLHLGHANVIKYCNRPFMTPEEQRHARLNPRSKQLHISPDTVERHDAALIDAVNALVRAEDELWVLGDFCWWELPPPRVEAYRRRITCRRVNLVRGNHDRPGDEIGDFFSRVIDGGALIEIEGQSIWVQHSPRDNWEGRAHGGWHLHGDVHGALDAADGARLGWLRKDVGVDPARYVPWSFADLRRYFAGRGRPRAD